MKISEMIMAVAGVLSILYGALIFSLKTGAKTFLLWFGLGIGLLLCACFLHHGVWNEIPKSAKRIIVTGCLLAVLSFVLVEGCIVSGFFATGEPDLDYLIVLGAQVTEKGPSKVLQYRLDAAFDYLEENEHTICIVSGGQGYNEPAAEAEIMRDYLLEKGIDEKRLIVESDSKTTLENMVNSSSYMKEDASVGIVTNNFHIFRGVRLAKHAGMKHVCGIAADAYTLYLPNNMLREYFGVLKDVGNIL